MSEIIYAALDTTDTTRALTLATCLDGVVGGLKLGLEFFIAQGPVGVLAVKAATGLPLFLDLKLHDIPNTVAAAVRTASGLGPAFLTIHAAGGAAMMAAAAEAAEAFGEARPRLLAVTVLTSLDEADLAATGQAGPALTQVTRLARLAQASGMDGVVCSPAEIAAVREETGPDFVLMVPGIRPAGSVAGDQKRVMTPRAARLAGADYLVIGRPITAAADPAAAARAIAEEMV